MIDKESTLIKLNPFLDEDEILRSNSRIINAEFLAYDTKYPILISDKSHLAKLIII